ncbi:MAG: DUF2845 domain-containing protein [Desulfobacterales bacterium]|jgi:hypothetical protein|nr:DUF2845 domain-containing protein [Desulfobacterales bacterium]
MKLKLIYFPMILTLVFGFSSQGFATGLRCGTHLITVGDTKPEVIARCGAPDYTEEWEEERIMRDFRHPFNYQKEDQWGREPFLVKVPVKFERWYYNFGPTQLIHYLKFRNGKLVKITTGERGY